MALKADHTIYAVSTGRGRSGIAVIRISGPCCNATVETVAQGVPEPRKAVLRWLCDPDTGERLDQGLVLWMPGPSSFTGEDSAEFHVHGGSAVVSAILAVLGRLDGLRPAGPGEFTRRAFSNGKLDLTQVEGLADLINAESEAQRRQALRQTQGVIAQAYENWRRELLHCLAYFEAEIDFPDESDVPADVTSALNRALGDLRASIERSLNDERRGERLRDGLQVVIAGRPNVGKSSLLNALAQRDAAIVSETAGTTRDVVEVHMDLKGYPVVLADTAGLRETGDTVEHEGVARARVRLEDADLVLWVTDPEDVIDDRPSDIAACAHVIEVLNKSDLLGESGGRHGLTVAPDGDETRTAISVKTGDGLGDLISLVAARAGDAFCDGENSVVTRERHRKALQDCLAHLAAAQSGWESGAELVAEDLRLAARALGRVTGRVDVEDLLDLIFRDFCIGK